MAAKRHKAEEIVTKLRQVNVLNAQGKAMAEAIRSIGVYGSYILPVAVRIRRFEARPGEASQGTGSGECAAAACGFRSDCAR